MIVYRNASLVEVALMLDWAAAEGWNPGLDDAAAFHAADPDGFFLALEDDVPVASISVVNHTESFAFLGFYIAKPSNRGRGIGHGLWRHAIAHAGDRTIGLDGVPEQQANYEASGFAAAGATTRFTGSIATRECASIRRAEKSDLEDLIDQEASATGVRKDAYLSAWFIDAPSRQTLVGEDGFCTVRKCREGAKIGPLHADDLETAEALIKHAAAQFGPQLTIDVPGQSKDLARLCRSLEMEPGFETARMYEGAKPLVGHSIFAVTSLELG